MTATFGVYVLATTFGSGLFTAAPVSQNAVRPSLPPCDSTTPVQAQAPPEPDTSPVKGWWHMSPDGALWAPSPPPGEPSVGVGRYWVRPAGQPLIVRGRRLDAQAPPVWMKEPGDARLGFFFGGPGTPTDGCWEFEATSGTSTATFVVEIHDTFERFVQRPTTRVTWSQVIGRLEAGDTRAVVTALVAEDPATRTRRLGGARIDLWDQGHSATLYESGDRLQIMRSHLEQVAAGAREGPFGLGRTHNVSGTTASLSVAGQDHTFTFGTRRFADLARLLVAARDALDVQVASQDDAAIRDLVGRYVAAREARDRDAIAALFTADADQLVSSGEWRRGLDAVVAGTLASSASTGGTRAITIEVVRMLGPDVAVADGRYEISGLAGGAVRQMWTSFLVVRQDGAWRICGIRNMLPAAPAAPPAAAP